MIRAKLALNPSGNLHGVILHREEWEAVCSVLERAAAPSDTQGCKTSDELTKMQHDLADLLDRESERAHHDRVAVFMLKRGWRAVSLPAPHSVPYGWLFQHGETGRTTVAQDAHERGIMQRTVEWHEVGPLYLGASSLGPDQVPK
jgi:hypothetical protein